MYATYTYVSLHVTTIFQTLGESHIHGIQSLYPPFCDFFNYYGTNALCVEAKLHGAVVALHYIQMCRAGGPGWLLYTRHS